MPLFNSVSTWLDQPPHETQCVRLVVGLGRLGNTDRKFATWPGYREASMLGVHSAHPPLARFGNAGFTCSAISKPAAAQALACASVIGGEFDVEVAVYT